VVAGAGAGAGAGAVAGAGAGDLKVNYLVAFTIVYWRDEMKIISEDILKNGIRRVLVEVPKDEDLFALHRDCHVRLGHPVKGVVHSSIIINANPVTWCSFEQKWVD
jgi:hypothetical protein